MPWGDGIPKIRCFSLTDIHDFESCPFRFFVRHNLERKAEIDDSSPSMALGTLLDESIKLFLTSNALSFGVDYLPNIINGALAKMKYNVSEKGSRSFYYKHMDFINDEIVQKANEVFKKYYEALDGKIKKSLGEVGFCEYVIDCEDGKLKFWGGPDTFELGDDGVPEVVDYKYHENPERGVSRLDMDLMPKMYILLSAKKLQDKGYSKARFVVRQWSQPTDDSLWEDFDLTELDSISERLKSKVQKILESKDLSF